MTKVLDWDAQEGKLRYLQANNIPVTEIAAHYGVSVSLIYKVLARVKRGPKNLPMTHQELYGNKKAKVISQGIPWGLTANQMTWPTTCPVLGAGVELDYFSRTHNDATPAITRCNPSLGYTPENVCVISLRAARGRGRISAAEHRCIADWMDGNASGAPEGPYIEE